MALIPPRFLDVVVALGQPTLGGEVRYTATGFLCGYPTGQNDEGQTLYRVFLVTNRHVVENTSRLIVRFNTVEGRSAKTYPIEIRRETDNQFPTVFVNANNDVAAITVNIRLLQSDGIEASLFISDSMAFKQQQAKTAGISEGDGVFVLGFPMGEAGKERNYTIVRQGILARVQDWLQGQADTFLIDCFIFPGNSGGPVFLRPEIASLGKTTPNTKCMFLGMISSYLPYQDVAMSQQTGKPRIIFEENSGLAVVVPFDVIYDTLADAVASSTKRAQEESPSEGGATNIETNQ